MARIMLAEDDVSLCKFLSAALERAGHSVAFRHNGLEALEALESGEAFDLLVTDIVMPGIDGIELAQIAARRHAHLKVMFITGFSASAVEDRTGAQSHIPLLSKPFHLNDLVRRIETLLQN